MIGRGVESRDRARPSAGRGYQPGGGTELSKVFGIANPVGRTVSIDLPGYGPIPESPVNLQIVGVIRSERTAD